MAERSELAHVCLTVGQVQHRVVPSLVVVEHNITHIVYWNMCSNSVQQMQHTVLVRKYP